MVLELEEIFDKFGEVHFFSSELEDYFTDTGREIIVVQGDTEFKNDIIHNNKIKRSVVITFSMSYLCASGRVSEESLTQRAGRRGGGVILRNESN